MSVYTPREATPREAVCASRGSIEIQCAQAACVTSRDSGCCVLALVLVTGILVTGILVTVILATVVECR